MSEYQEPRPVHDAATESCFFLESCLRVSLLKENEWAETRLIDFNLWASGVGVFAKPPTSLDDRLKDNEDVQSVVLSLLSTFNVFLKLCIDHGGGTGSNDSKVSGASAIEKRDGNIQQQHDGNEQSIHAINKDDYEPTLVIPTLQQAKADADAILVQLIRLGKIIRAFGSTSRYQRADALFTFEDYLNLSNITHKHSSKIYVQDLRELRSHLVAKLFMCPKQVYDNDQAGFSEFRPSLEGLDASHQDYLEHLVFANLRRRNRYWYSKKHASKLAASYNIDPIDQTTMGLSVTQSRDAEMGKRSGEKNLREKERLEEGSSGPAPYPIITDTTPSENKINLDKPKIAVSSHQALSRVSTSIRKSGWPNPPHKEGKRKTFMCPCCHQTLLCSEAESRNWWNKHLTLDINPYTCIFPQCPEESSLFARRDEWKAHLQQNHRTSNYWQCFACTNADKAMNFENRNEFIYHLQKDHSSSVTEDEASILSEISVKSSPLLIKFCPLCVVEPQRTDLDPEVLLDHIGDHIHEFSLLSLPWNDIPDPNSVSTVLNAPWIDFPHPGNNHLLSRNNIHILQKWFDSFKPDAQERTDLDPEVPLDHIGDHVHEVSLLSLSRGDIPDPNSVSTVLNAPWIDFPHPGNDHLLLTSDNLRIFQEWFDSFEPGAQEHGEQWPPAYPSDETIKRAETLSAGFIDSPSTKISGRTGPSPTEAYFSEIRGDTSCAQSDLLRSPRDSLASSESESGDTDHQILPYRISGSSTMSPPLTNHTEVFGYLEKNMLSLKFRAHAQYFLPRRVLNKVSQRTVIKHTISEDREMNLGSQESERFINKVHQVARKLFAICMYCEMPPSYLKHLLDGGLSDDDFPLIADKHPIWSPKYQRSSVKYFLENQKRFNAVFFEHGSFQSLDDSRPIPVAFDEEFSSLLGKGAFGEVWKVRIHEDQHSFDCDETNREWFAMKVIQHEKSIAREKQFISDTKNLKHDHLVKCYASWKFGAKYHMIYELAECNLEEFIQKTNPKDHTALNNAWLTQQMCGLAGALRAVHIQGEDERHTSNDNMLGVPTAPKARLKSGYIHDIKPDNILVFPCGDSLYELRLSDFSCAKVVDFVTSISGQHGKSHLTASKSGTPDFRPPESMIGKTSRPYDLWSLGGVYLELLVWFLQGYRSLEAFRDSRRGNVRPNGAEDEAFYFTDEDNANPRIQLRWAVVEKISELSRICPSDLRPLLDVIPSLLHIDPLKRPTATILEQQLRHPNTSTPFEFGKASSRNTKALNVPTTAQLGLPQNDDSGSESDNQFVIVSKPTKEEDG